MIILSYHNQCLHLNCMKKTRSNPIINSLLKTNAMISIVILGLLITVFFLSNYVKATPSDKASTKVEIKKHRLDSKVTALSTQSLKTKNDSQQRVNLSYRTVLPFHEKKKNTANKHVDYVIFSPKKELSAPYYRYVHKRNVKTFSDITFFEKAMLFNDKLQTWVN